MRRFAALMAIMIVLLCGCARATEPAKPPPDEIRGVWISYLDLSMEKESDKSAQAFRKKAQIMLHNLSESGFNTVFLQVRPFGDALYASDLFSYSKILTGEPGKDPGYDPLKIFCTFARKEGLSLHAWINPFRVCPQEQLKQRPPWDEIQKLQKEDPSLFFETDGILYLNPAAVQTRRLLLRGVRELLEHYSVDGVHIDDYFYPSTDPQIDVREYSAYHDAGGTKNLADWRRESINIFVSQLYAIVKSFGQEKIFSISPAVRIAYDRDMLFADVQRWGANDGYCDWLIPQLYVGFRHTSAPFEKMLEQWSSAVSAPHVRLLTGLAAYKCGQSDPYAGAGQNEWIEHTDILPRQIDLSRRTARYAGFVLFAYGNLFGSESNAQRRISVPDLIFT